MSDDIVERLQNGGGFTPRAKTPEQREADYDARVLISSELGHSREAITAAYLGR